MSNPEKDDREQFPPPSNPMAVARAILSDGAYLFQISPTRLETLYTLRHWRGSWMRWNGPAWAEVEERKLRSELYHRLEHGFYEHKNKKDEIERKDWEPNRSKLRNLLEAVGAQTLLAEDTQPPSWLDKRTGMDTIVSCTNGLLDVSTRTLHDHSPVFFNEIHVPFAYDPNAPEPTEWLTFLDQLWPGDPESIALLQEWFGYVLSGSTVQQKMLGIIGPMRSGKGTICRVLKGLVGERNIAAPTLSAFGQHFGLYVLIGKPVAIIADVRLGTGEQHAVVERLLNISGEDPITLDRKYKDPWTGQLPTRIMFVSNELPRFGDSSGAIASRCLILETTQSFLGHEDTTLGHRLLGELPGILNWSLDGLETITRKHVFTEPQSSRDAIAALLELVSPISAFVRERCVRAGEVEVPVLYAAWRAWAEENGHRLTNSQTFGRDLRAIISGLRMTQPRDGGKRVRAYTGVSLRTD